MSCEDVSDKQTVCKSERNQPENAADVPEELSSEGPDRGPNGFKVRGRGPEMPTGFRFLRPDIPYAALRHIQPLPLGEDATFTIGIDYNNPVRPATKARRNERKAVAAAAVGLHDDSRERARRRKK